MIKSKEEYYSILERLRELNFNQKLGRNLQAKLEAFEEMEELVNLTIPVVSNTEGKLCDKCYDTDGFYLGTTCPKCNKPFRSVKA